MSRPNKQWRSRQQSHPNQYNNKRARHDDRNGHNAHPSATRPVLKLSASDYPLLSAYVDGISETAMGITQYLYTHEPISGLIKQSPHDFIVHEIDAQHATVRLTEQNVVILDAATKTTTPPVESAQLADIVGADIAAKFSSWHDNECARIREWLSTHPQPKRPAPIEFVFDTALDKLQRTQLHRAVRTALPTVATDAITRGDETLIRARHVTLTPRDERDARDLGRWAQNAPTFLHMTLFKQNVTTMDAIASLAQNTHTSNKTYAFAGTKDRRALTTQRVSAFKVSAEKVLSSCDFKRYGFTVGNFSYHHDGLRLGDLSGNRFDIILRNVTGITYTSNLPLILLKKEIIFINYFGLQRFGTSSIPTYLIGISILRNEWSDACALILLPNSSSSSSSSSMERNDVRQARQYFAETYDCIGALNKMPHFMRSERQILTVLSQRPADFVGAISTLPRTMRMMYVRALQSYIWNFMVSTRLKLDANNVIEGDLVYIERADEVSVQATSQSQSTEISSAEESTDSHNVGDDTMDDNIDMNKVHIVTADDITNTRFKLTDVVLPLPGYRMQYPRHQVTESYDELLMSIGLERDHFSQSALKEYRLSGQYRRILATATNVTVQRFMYSYPTRPLKLSDLQAMQQQQQQQEEEQAATSTSLSSVTESTPDGHLLALVLSFDLPASSYATMLIRELTRQSTSVLEQKNLHAQHQQNETKRDERKDNEEMLTNTNTNNQQTHDNTMNALDEDMTIDESKETDKKKSNT